MIKTIFIDLDGTITDNFHIHTRGWNAILAILGYELDPTFFQTLHGASTNEAILNISTKCKVNLSPSDLEFFVSIKNQVRDYEISKLSRENLFPGVLDFLETQKSVNRRLVCAAITNACKSIINVLELNNYFSDFICGNQMNPSKSKSAQVFLDYAIKHNLLVNECLIIDDDPTVIQYAQQSGFKVIWFNPKYRETDLNALPIANSFYNLCVDF